jgi:hypothetical protein
MISTMDSQEEAGTEDPHDVLAAEAFAMPTADPALRHGPLRLPEDLTGSEEPRDVLIAEEFAMPTGHPHAAEASDAASARPRSLRDRRFWVAAGGVLLALVRWRRRGRRSS